ncbi:MAG TPA: S-4TM family putative pore-forming effector [Solirubrobacterales bacterium]
MTATSIFERQNDPEALGLARAFRRRYAVARRWRLLRVGVGLLIGTVGVLLALLEPSTEEYVSAIAAAWLVFGRTVLDGYEERQRRCGALAQELFDTRVFDLPWSPSSVGSQPAPEDVRNWARRQGDEGLRDWYADARPARAPVDVLLSQRAIITWARQDHVTYAHLLRWAAGIAFTVTVVIGLVLGLSLGEYLLRLGVPVLPACLDVLDIAKANAQVASTKKRLERRADVLLVRARTSETPPTIAECRELQDGIYATRLLPGVPSWMYAITRGERQRNMEETVGHQASTLPAALRRDATSSADSPSPITGT